MRLERWPAGGDSRVVGGIAAAVVLIAFGIAAIVMGASGHSTVGDNLSEQKIVGTPDMTPAAIKAEAAKAGLNSTLPIPSCSVAGKHVQTGSEARCFAQYMNIHALEATGGLYYARMPRYATANGQGTDIEASALKGPNGKPVENPARNVWIQATALATALNTSYMATQVSIFGIVVGVALLLSGIGFAILAVLSIGGSEGGSRPARAVEPSSARGDGQRVTPSPTGA